MTPPETEATIDPLVLACLNDLDLLQYAEVFRSHDIGWDVLPILTDMDLEKIGITSLGHRKRLLARIHGHGLATLPGQEKPRLDSVLEITRAALAALQGSGNAAFRIDVVPSDGQQVLRIAAAAVRSGDIVSKVGSVELGASQEALSLLRMRVLDYERAFKFRRCLRCAKCRSPMNDGATTCSQCWTKNQGIEVPNSPSVPASGGSGSTVISARPEPNTTPHERRLPGDAGAMSTNHGMSVESSSSAAGTSRALAAVAQAFVITGVFLPFTSKRSGSVSGITTLDGKIVLVVSLFSLVLLALSQWGLATRVPLLVAGVAHAIMFPLLLGDLSMPFGLVPGPGLYLMTVSVGVVAALYFTAWARSKGTS